MAAFGPILAKPVSPEWLREVVRHLLNTRSPGERERERSIRVWEQIREWSGLRRRTVCAACAAPLTFAESSSPTFHERLSMQFGQLLLGAAMLGAAACGGGSTNPNPPPPGGGATQTLATIRVTNPTVALAAGATATLVAEALDAAGRVISGATGYTYSSSAPGVAELQGDGAVLAVSAGTATITVSLARNGVTATSTAAVTVTGSLPGAATVNVGAGGLTFTPPTLVVARNASVTFAFAPVNHNVTFRTVVGAPTNVPNTTAASVVRAFAAAGDFPYDCSLHAGMTGMVMVR